MALLDLNSSELGAGLNQNPQPFAKLYVYTEDKDILAPIYRDDDLTLMQANPLQADEEGHFSKAFLMDGSYRIQIKNARGVLLDELHDVALSSDGGAARDWATAEENVIVEGGQFSARHHAAKSAQASGDAQAALAAALSVIQAAGAPYFDSVSAGLGATANGDLFLVVEASGESTIYRNDAGLETALGKIGEAACDTAADFFAALVQYEVGSTISTRCEGFAYTVADAAATDHQIVHPATGQKLYIHPGEDGRHNVLAWGAVRDGATDDTAAIQAAIDHCHENYLSLNVPGGPYLITSLNVECPMIGTIQRRFAGGGATFISDVGADVFALEISNYDGRLESITLRNTGAGNGIWCKLCGTVTVLRDISCSTMFPRLTGSGSIGVAFGSEANPGQQAITGTYDSVNARDYDICFDMRYYSNSNTYKQLYALATNNTVQPASVGFRINGRGGTFLSCNVESNFNLFLDEQGGAGGAEENTYIGFWAEGVPGAQINLFGKGSLMINPYGFVGGSGGTISVPINKGAYAKVVKNKPGTIDVSNFDSQGKNLVQNADFAEGLGGLNWGNYATPSGSTLFGHNAISIQNNGPATSVSCDHLLNYLDLNVHSWLRGKTVTMACFGQAESGVTMTIRGVVRTASGSNMQYATSQAFSETGAEAQRISFNIPEDPADARYLVFRIYASGVTSGTPSKAGEIALPMVFLGNELQDVVAQPASDGENLFYGTQSIQGGGHDEGHLVLGGHHLWVDQAGALRIKNGAPISDMDGGLVGS